MTRPSETVNIIETGDHGAESFGPLFSAEVSLWKAWNLIEERERESANFRVLKYHDDVLFRTSFHGSRCITLYFYFYQKTHWNIDFYRWKYLSIESILENKNSFIPLGNTLFEKLGIYDILIDLFKKPDSNFPLAINPITGKWSQNSNQSTETNTEPFTLHIWLSTTPPPFFSKTKNKILPWKKNKRKKGRKKESIYPIYPPEDPPSIHLHFSIFFFFSPSSKPRSISIIPVYSALNRRA